MDFLFVFWDGLSVKPWLYWTRFVAQAASACSCDWSPPHSLSDTCHFSQSLDSTSKPTAKNTDNAEKSTHRQSPLQKRTGKGAGANATPGAVPEWPCISSHQSSWRRSISVRKLSAIKFLKIPRRLEETLSYGALSKRKSHFLNFPMRKHYKNFLSHPSSFYFLPDVRDP